VLEGLASELFATRASEADHRALRHALKNIEAALRNADRSPA
jgi:DNA-binding GntR family transcriptional regulator